MGAGFPRFGLMDSIVIFATEVRDQFFPTHEPQRVLQFHHLDEQIVFGV